MLTVENLLTEVVITNRLTAPLPVKMRIPENVYTTLLKLPFKP